MGQKGTGSRIRNTGLTWKWSIYCWLHTCTLPKKSFKIIGLDAALYEHSTTLYAFSALDPDPMIVMTVLAKWRKKFAQEWTLQKVLFRCLFFVPFCKHDRICEKYFYNARSRNLLRRWFDRYSTCAENFKHLWGARNRVWIGLSYRPARLHRLAKLIPWNRFMGSFKV